MPRSARSSSTSRYDSAKRRYQRTERDDHLGREAETSEGRPCEGGPDAASAHDASLAARGPTPADATEPFAASGLLRLGCQTSSHRNRRVAAKVRARAKPSSTAVGTSRALAPLPRTSTSSMPSGGGRSGRALLAVRSHGGSWETSKKVPDRKAIGRTTRLAMGWAAFSVPAVASTDTPRDG